MLNGPRRALEGVLLKLHEMVVKFVAGHELCRRLMADPGCRVRLTALSFVTAIDDPSRFQRLTRCGGLFWADLAALAVRHVD